MADRVVSEELLKCVPSRTEQQYECGELRLGGTRFIITHGLRIIYYEDKWLQ